MGATQRHLPSEGFLMNGNHFARRMGSRRSLLALLASSAVITTGCSNLATTAPTASPLATGGTLSGTIHGGSQPVAFATVTLYFAGQNGVGSGDGSVASLGNPIVAAVTTSADDGHGSFTFHKKATAAEVTTPDSFACPGGGNSPLVYAVARGGNPLGNHDSGINNSASAFIAMYGPCSEISSANVVTMNEVTTVATMVALQQYFNPATESIGADGIGLHYLAFTQTLSTISNLADMSTGSAITSKNTTSGPATVTITPETAKINALANIIASCVNNQTATASPCTTLFANAIPPDGAVTARPYRTSFAQATDVLQALYYILTNPTNGSTANLNNLYNLIPGTAAFQPSLSAAPSDWTVAINYSSTGTCGTSDGNLINQPQELALDRYGNLWIANGQAGTVNLAGIKAGGTAFSCTFLGGDAHGIAVDSAMNIWYASHADNKLYRYNQFTNITTPFVTHAPPLAVFADNSNIYFTTDADTSVYMIQNYATADPAAMPVQISSTVGTNPNHLIVDATHAIWVSSGGTFVSRIAPGSQGDATYLNGYTTTQFPVAANDSAVTVGPGSSPAVFVASDVASSVTYLSGSGNSYSTTSGWPNVSGRAGINNPKAIAVDGRLNIWTANGAANSVSEISANGVALMPSGGRQFDSSVIADPRTVVIDLSGNVWVAGNGPVGTPSNSITEIVGAAVPVFQPYSLGYGSDDRFQRLP